MSGWMAQQTSTGATYLQVAILAGLFLFVVTPLAYVTVRDWARVIKQEFLSQKKER